MPETQPEKNQDLNPVPEARPEELLSEQTSVILKTTDQKIDDVKKDVKQLLSKQTEDVERLLSKQTEDMEQLLADQADVILEAVDNRIDKKMDQKLHPVINKLDAILGEVQKHREEDVSGAAQLRRHEDQLRDYGIRIKKLEVSPRT